MTEVHVREQLAYNASNFYIMSLWVLDQQARYFFLVQRQRVTHHAESNIDRPVQ